MVAAQHRPPGPEHPDYAPRVLPIARRIAAHTANLVTLAVVVNGRLAVSTLDPGGHAQSTWQALTLLWQSQLSPEEWDRLMDVLDIERVPADVSVVLRQEKEIPRVDMAWLFGFDLAEPANRSGFLPDMLEVFRRQESFRPFWQNGHALHIIEPLVDGMEPALNALVLHRGKLHSLGRLLLTALTDPDPAERFAAYETTLSALGRWTIGLGERYCTVLFDALSRDEATTVPLLEKAVLLGLHVDVSPDSRRRSFDLLHRPWLLVST